ncbi:MAG: hypothetical protein JW829_00845 [Pirellulales bacterium]|nr:hypothetical protein [Pirellulales bacterium]
MYGNRGLVFSELVRRLVAWAAAVMVAATLAGPVCSEVLVDVPDPGPSHTPSSSLSPTSIFSQPFTLDTPAANVLVRPMIDRFGSTAGPIDIYLTTRVGPGTTQSDVVASVTILNAPDRAYVNAFTVPAMQAGEYFLTMFNDSNVASYGWPFPNVPVTVTGTIGPHRFIDYRFPQDANTTFPPASNFKTASSVSRYHIVQITGNPIDFLPPVDGGGGTVIQMDIGNILGNGVSTDGKRTFHRLAAQSVNGSTPVTDTGSIERVFTFEHDGDSSDPIDVKLVGELVGLLATDNLGDASVRATLALADGLGHSIGTDSVDLFSNAPLGFQEEIHVNERLEIFASLTPGALYTLSSSLTVNASSPFGGAGRALFDNTYVVDVVASSPIPEPAALPCALILLTISAAGQRRVRRR